MNDYLFLSATLGIWIGLALLAVGVARGLRGWLGEVAPEVRSASLRSAARFLAVAVCLLLVCLPLTLDSGAPRLPLVWVFMTAPGWLAVGCFIGFVLEARNAITALNDQEQRTHLIRLVLWGVGAFGFGLWQWLSPMNATIFRGSVPLTAGGIGAVLGLAVLALMVMVVVQRSAAARTWARGFALHGALIAGSIVFGIPFVWLLVTSFKEDRDMVNTGGLQWIPKVEVTVPYVNPNKFERFYSTRWEGRKVRVTIDSELTDGRLEVQIDRPLGIRGRRFITTEDQLTTIPRQAPIVMIEHEGQQARGFVAEDLANGNKNVEITQPEELAGTQVIKTPGEVEHVREVGLRWQNYVEALEFMPPETNNGLAYLKNTLIIVVMSVVGTILSSSLVAYAFSRLRFPGKSVLFGILLATMMLPAAITMLPQFLIFRSLGWIDTLLPLWVPAFFATAFNVFLLRQFFMTIPMELEDASKIDGCSYLRTWWQVMLPQIYPALAVIAIWTFMAGWNNFMGPLIYINSPEKMPIAYATQLFYSDRSGDPGMLMAFSTMATVPVLVLFFFAQRYFIEGVQLSGLGGR